MKKQLQFNYAYKLMLFVFLYLAFNLKASYSQAPMFVNTTAPSGGCNSFPFSNTTTSRKVQFIYLANEFVGATGGAINRIWIRPCTAVSGTVYTNLSVRMRQEPNTVTTFPSGTFLTPVQTCLSAATFSFTTTANTWYPIPLSTPFVYDPTKTLIIEIEQQSYTGTGFTINQSSPAGNKRIWGDFGASTGSAGTAYADMGIDVVSLGNNDIGVSSIDSPGVFCANNQNVFATIKNFGKNQVTGFNVHWSINGVIQPFIASTATLDTLGGTGSSTLQMQLGNFTFPSGVNTTIKSWTSMPNSVVDTVRTNDSSTVVKTPAMSGNFTIGGTGPNNYATFDAAIAAMNVGGICGPVVFTVASGTITRTTAITVPDIAGTSHINTITFEGVDANTRIITGAIASSGVVIFNASKYVIFRNFTVTNTSATAPIGIAAVGSTRKITIFKCRVNVPVVVGTSAVGYGINFTGSALGNGASACAADSAIIDSNIVTGGGYGIVHFGSSNAAANRGIIITNNTVNSNNYMGAYVANNFNPILLNCNTINMTGATYGYYGLYWLNNQSAHATVSHQITRNRINNFGGYGMYISNSVQNVNAAKLILNNNVLSSFNSGTYYGYYGIYLIQIANTVADVYHNTVVMNGTSTNAVYSAFYNTGSSMVNVKNNIFATYGGNYTPVYLATSLIGNTLNYNIYYNGGNPTTGNLIYRNATFYNPANFQSATIGGDTCFNLNPPFVSRLPLPGNLKLTDGCSGFGVDLTADVPNDYDALPRTVTPTLGAFQFTGGIANNLAVTTLLTPAAPIVLGSQDVRFVVKNIGNNTVNFYNASYSLNNGTPITMARFSPVASCANDTVEFTGANQITLGPTNSLKVYSDGPNGMLDADRTNDTISNNFFAPLNGTYTVGGVAPDFATLTAAINALANGVGGPVVFDIRAGTYSGQVIINGPIVGASAINTITFEGNIAATRIITANILGATILVNNARFVRFRNLTITNTNTGNCAGIAVVGASGSYNSSGVQIVKCNVNVPILTGTASTGYGIIFTGTAGGTGISALGADSCLIDSNTVTGGGYAIVFYGSTNAAFNRNIVVTNNMVNSCNYMGGYISYIYNPVLIHNNTFNMLGQQYGYYGLYCISNQNNNSTVSSRYTSNKVYNFGGYGIYIATPQQTTGAAKTFMSNNLLVSFNAGTYYGYYGLYVSQVAGCISDIYHNTIIMNGPSTSTTYSCLYTTGSINTNIKNNIFIVNTGLYTPVYCVTNPTLNAINYNVYYNGNNPATGNLIYRNATFYNPTNYKNANNGGDSSFNFLPPFVGTNNYNLANGCIRGVNLTADVPLDINGTTRSTTPNIGAYEYAGFALDLMVESLSAPSFPVSLGLQDVRAVVRNNGTSSVTSFNISYSLNNGTPVSIPYFGNLAPCDTVTMVFTNAQQINLVNPNNTIKVYTSLPNSFPDDNPVNDTLNRVLLTPLIGTYIVGAAPSDYATFNAALTAAQTRGVGGSVIFNVKTGTYNEGLIIGNIQGADANSTVTFKSLANHVDSVVLVQNSGINNNFVVRYNGGRFVNFRSLTITQQNVTYGRAIEFTGSSESDSIISCKLNSPIGAYTSTNNCVVFATGFAGSNIVLRGNTITGGSYGMYMYGVSATVLINNLIVENNNFINFYYMGYYNYFTLNMKVRNNYIYTNSVYSTLYGMYNFYADGAFELTRNKVYFPNVANIQYGIRNGYCDSVGGLRSIMANNTVSIGGTTNYGLYDQYNSGVQMHHNSVLCRQGAGYAYYIYQSSTIYANNEYYNNIGRHRGTGYAIYSYSNLYALLNNNLWSTNGTLLAQAGLPAGTYANLTLWRAATSMDRNSISYPIVFSNDSFCTASLTDTTSWAANARGRFVPSVLTDINGNPRSSVMATGAPDIGAYEFVPNSIPPRCAAVPVTPVAGGTQSFLFGLDTVCKIVYDPFAMVPSSVIVRQYTGTIPPQIGSATGYMNFYVDAQAPVGTYNYTMNLFYKEEWRGNVVNEIDTRMAKKNSGSPWVAYLFTGSNIDTLNNIITAPFLNDFSWFTGTDNTNPLPIKLMSFKGEKVKKNVSLTWATASEINAKLFDVERSFDGVKFSSVANVAAAGNSKDMVKYAYLDNDVITDYVNIIYYRLKMVDADGSFKYSNTVTVLNNAKENTIQQVSVYPNPFKSELTINDEVGVISSLAVKDINGRVVFTKALNMAIGETKVELPNNLESGIYFVVLNNERVIKMIKN